MDGWLTVFSLAFSLFLLMDPLGNIPLFIALLKELNPARQRVIILREMVIALLVIILFSFIGDLLLDLLKVQYYTIMIAGGIILFLIAIKMIFPQPKEKNGTDYGKEPLVVPLAIPLVAGPAVLAAVILYSHKYETMTSILGIVIAWIFSTVILLSATSLKRVLGPRGILACERLMGLLLTLIAVQLFMEGMTAYLASP